MLGVSRTVRRRKGGQVIVAIAFRNRPWHAVLADMIDGVLHINNLEGAALCRARDDLWETFSEVAKAAA